MHDWLKEPIHSTTNRQQTSLLRDAMLSAEMRSPFFFGFAHWKLAQRMRNRLYWLTGLLIEISRHAQEIPVMPHTQTRLNPICRTSGEHCHAFPQVLLGLRGTTDCEFEHTGCGISAEQVAVVPRGAAHFFAGKNADSQLLVVDLDVADLRGNSPAPRSIDTPSDELFAEPRFMHMSDDLRQLTRCAARQLARMPEQTGILTYQWATLLTAQTQLLFAANAPMQPDQRINLDRLIDARLNSPPSNHELQRALSMSSTRLNGWARERFGMTPQQRVLKRRLQWAEHWLTTTDKPISHIAHDLGFCNSSALTHACRRVLGRSPSELRHQLAPH